MEDELLDIDIDEAKIGTPFYQCYFNLENLKVVETWIYQGYQKWERTDPDCDTPHHYYVFTLHGGDPRSPYQVGIPRKATSGTFNANLGHASRSDGGVGLYDFWD